MSRHIETFRRMVEAEKDYSSRLASSAKDLPNPVVRAVILAVSRDSEKHFLLYQTLLEMASGPSTLLTEEEADRIAAEIERHIKTEAEMIARVEEILEKGELDKASRFILELILRDERVHHAMLRRLHEVVVRRESFTETDMWDMVWKDTTFHGAPGG